MYGEAHAALQALRHVLTTKRLVGKLVCERADRPCRGRGASYLATAAVCSVKCTLHSASSQRGRIMAALRPKQSKRQLLQRGLLPGMVRCGILKQTCVRLGMYNTCADIGRCVRIQALTSSTHTRNATTAPLHSPTTAPTHSPTTAPTHSPTTAPTHSPTTVPTRSPTAAPRPTPQPTPAAPTPRPTLFTPYPAPRIVEVQTFNKTSGSCLGTWEGSRPESGSCHGDGTAVAQGSRQLEQVYR